MARIRSVKPELPSSRKLAAAPIEARYTFVLLITQADDEGFVRAEPRQLLGALYPHDESVTPDALETWILALVRVKSIRLRWTSDGARVVQVLGWEEHQSIKQPGKPKISPTLLPFSADSSESVGIIPTSHPQKLYAEVVVVGGTSSDIRIFGGSEEGAAGAAAATTSSADSSESVGIIPTSQPSDGLADHFAESAHRAAYLAYRATHRMPDALDAVLTAAHAGGMGGHPARSWPVLGAALLAMRAVQAEFGQNALHGFARRVGELPPPDRVSGTSRAVAMILERDAVRQGAADA